MLCHVPIKGTKRVWLHGSPKWTAEKWLETNQQFRWCYNSQELLYSEENTSDDRKISVHYENISPTKMNGNRK